MPGNPELLSAAVEATLGARCERRVRARRGAGLAGAEQAPAAQDDLDFTALIKQAGQVFDAEPLPDDS